MRRSPRSSVEGGRLWVGVVPLRIPHIYGIFTNIYLKKSTKCRWIYMKDYGFEMMLDVCFYSIGEHYHDPFQSNCSTCWVINVFGWAWNCQLVANCQRISMNITNPPPCIFVSMQLLCTHHLVVALTFIPVPTKRYLRDILTKTYKINFDNAFCFNGCMAIVAEHPIRSDLTSMFRLNFHRRWEGWTKALIPSLPNQSIKLVPVSKSKEGSTKIEQPCLAAFL